MLWFANRIDLCHNVGVADIVCCVCIEAGGYDDKLGTESLKGRKQISLQQQFIFRISPARQYRGI